MRDEDKDFANNIDRSVEMLGAMLLFAVATAVVSLIAFLVIIWRY